MPDADLHQRCENWGAWARGEIVIRATQSFEGQYRSPQSAHWKAPVPIYVAPVDALDARLVEHAVCVIPIYHHAILRGWYCFRAAPATCLRRAARAAQEERGRVSGWEASLAIAHALLAGALALPAAIRRDRARELVMHSFAVDDPAGDVE